MSAVSTLRRVLFWLGGLTLGLLLLIVTLVGIAISTETGLNALLGVASRFAPGQLSYQRINGRLTGPLQIEGFRYEDGALKVKLDRADLDWQPADLFNGRLTIAYLRFNGLEVHLPPSQEPPPSSAPFTLPDIQLPLEVTVADLQGRDIRIVPAGAAPIQIDAIDLKARTEGGALLVETLEVKSPLGQARLHGQVNPTGNYPLDLDLAWQAPVANYGVLNGESKIQGELRETLHILHNVTGPATVNLEGQVRHALTEAAWSVKTHLNVPDLKPFVPDLAGKPLTAQVSATGVMAQFQGQGEIRVTAPQLGPTVVQFNANGDPEAITLKTLRVDAPDWPLSLTAQGNVRLTAGALGQFQAQGDLDAKVPDIGPAKLHFGASGDPQTIKLDILRLATPGRPLTLTAQGVVQLPELRFNATGEWQSLAWPLQGIAQVESAKGTFRAEGTPKDYQFAATADDLRGPNVPKGSWTITGQGSDQAVRDVKLAGKILEGSLQATADATWIPAIGWKAAVNGLGINPGAHWKEAPGKLNFQLQSDGGLENGILRANVLLETLNGVLSGQKVAGNADVSVLGQHLTIRNLQVNAGNAHLEARGALTDRWDLTWNLNVPQLKALVASVNGTVASTGKLSGLRERPVVATTFTVRDLRQGANRIQQLRGEANLDIGGASRSRLNVTGSGLALGGQEWKSLQLDGAGTPTAHELKAELNGAAGNFLLALAGSLQQPAMLWQGRITQLSARNTPAGNWNLEKPVTVRASAKEAGLDLACLSSSPTRVCLQGQWRQSGDFSGRVQLSNLSPDRFKRFLPPDMALATNLNGEASASGKIGGTLQGKLDLNIAPGSVDTKANGKPVHIPFNGGVVQVNTNGQTATGQARLDLGRTGQLQANLQVQDLTGAIRLNGKVDADITDLTLVKAFVPQITDISGQVRANIAIGGAAANPLIRGEARLANAAVTIPEAGLKLRNIQFTATSTGQGPIRLAGSADSDPGQVQLAGQVDPAKPQLQLTVTGENFQAIKSTEIQVQISPDIQLDITPQMARVEGSVTIPRAFVRPSGGPPGTVSASSDTVIVKQRDGTVPEAKGSGLATYANVRVVLGQEVYLETPAFKGKLQGDIQVVETPQLAPRGTGNVEVVAGNYKIYGEEIEIQRGQLLFSSSPLDNPALDLRVVRQERDIISGDEIMAGAQVRGTLKNPKLTFFSTPTMSDPDILAYLVLGRAPGSGSTESAMLFKAASALGSGQTAGITNSLSDTFGLDSAELGSTSQGGTSFMVGKYLTPRLYVGYGIALLDAVNTFFLKYRFTKHLMLESATNSLGTGGDAIYTIEY